MEHLVAKHQPYRDTDGKKVPVARIATPSNPTIKGVASLIIDEVGDGVPIKGSETAVSERAMTQLRSAENGLLFFDDAQHVVDHRPLKDQLRFTDWCKNLADETGTALILVGLARVHELISLNDQLFRRFNDTAHMRRLSWEDEYDRSLFLDILACIQSQLTDFDTPQLDADEMGFRMYAATGGLIGYLVKMIEEAERIARRNGSKTITVDTLADAHDFVVYRKAVGLERPFDMRMDLGPDPETLAHIQTMGLTSAHAERVLAGTLPG